MTARMIGFTTVRNDRMAPTTRDALIFDERRVVHAEAHHVEPGDIGTGVVGQRKPYLVTGRQRPTRERDERLDVATRSSCRQEDLHIGAVPVTALTRSLVVKSPRE